MGVIEIRKFDKQVKVGVDGKLYTNMPIDWDTTLKLWYEDEEAYRDRTLVRHDSKEVYTLYYNRASATYNNNSFYQLHFNKDLKARLKQRIKEGLIIDAPYLNKKVYYGK